MGTNIDMLPEMVDPKKAEGSLVETSKVSDNFFCVFLWLEFDVGLFYIEAKIERFR